MNRAMTAPVLEPVGEGKVALQSVNVEAEIENLLCEVTIKQSLPQPGKNQHRSRLHLPAPPWGRPAGHDHQDQNKGTQRRCH